VPRLAVSEDDVPEAFTVGVRRARCVIVVTGGLLRTLEAKEIEAVLAHELAHVLNRDGAVMTVASFPLFAGAWLFRAAQRRPVTWFGSSFSCPTRLPRPPSTSSAAR
jgi:heat shock protein HtpX